MDGCLVTLLEVYRFSKTAPFVALSDISSVTKLVHYYRRPNHDANPHPVPIQAKMEYWTLQSNVPN